MQGLMIAEELDEALDITTVQMMQTSWRYQALLLIRRHIDTTLRQQYPDVTNPADLWQQLLIRFEHNQQLLLPQARNEWMTLRVMDYPNLQDFNAALHRIAAHLRLCGERVSDAELIDKTLSTFPPATAILAQQYRLINFTTHAELMSSLLLAEKQQLILLKNAEVRPAREIHASTRESPASSSTPATPASTSSAAPPATPATTTTPAASKEAHSSEAAKRSPRGGRGRGRGRDDRRHRDDYYRRDSDYDRRERRDHRYNDRPYPRTEQSQSEKSEGSDRHDTRDKCHKCGRPGHYARECRAPVYVTDMYRELQNLRESRREAHTLDAPSFSQVDSENYMVQSPGVRSHADRALLDSASTHTILRSLEFFNTVGALGPWLESELLTIAGSRNFRFREGRATVILPGGFPLKCEMAMFAPDAPRSLISYRDLRNNGIHLSTSMESDEDSLELIHGTSRITKVRAGKTGLYEMQIGAPDAADTRSCSLTVLPKTQLWHKRLGHPGTTMLRRMIPALAGHNLHSSDADKMDDCMACIQGKYAKHPSRWRLPTELPQPLERLHGDICGPINPPSGQFLYFLVLVDASGSHAEVSLLTTRNMAFPKILAMLIRFRNHFPDRPIKSLRMDNAGEFKSHAFEDYCTATGIALTYSVPYEHSQNGLAEAYIKKIQLVARPLLIHAQLPASLWSHAVLHAATLLRFRPTLLNTQASIELVSGRTPNVSHLRTFGCQVWVPVPEPAIRTISAHREEGIYVGFDSPSIIRYINTRTTQVHKARFENCRFVETIFPTIPSPPGEAPLTFRAPISMTMNPDPRTTLPDEEVKKLIHLQTIAARIPDSFESGPRILRNPLPGSSSFKPAPIPKKRPAPTPAKTKSVRKPKVSKPGPEVHVIDTEPDIQTEIEAFVTMLTHIDRDPLTLEEARNTPEWPEWKKALNAEYESLRKRQVFGELHLNLSTKPIGYKLVFNRKRNEQGQIVRYKIRCVAQGFNQRPGVDFDQTYSPVMDTTSFRYLLALAVQLSLATQLLDVVTAYLYGEITEKLFIKPPPEFLPSAPSPRSGQFAGLQLRRALYGLKQAGRAWYHHLRSFLTKQGFTCDQALPCIFVLRKDSNYVILAVYVDDINLVGHPKMCSEVEHMLIQKFEMKLLGKTCFCLGLQVKHLKDGSILLHQESYTKRLLQNFNMAEANSISAPMIGRSKSGEDPYRSSEEEEEEVDRKRYLAAVGALLYLATHTRPDISFAVSVLARHSRRPTHRHWNGIKHLLRYLRGTEDLGLYFTKTSNSNIVGFADSGYRTDEVNGKSQTGYIFLRNGGPISWKSVKQTVTATSTNHAELIALHEAAREAVWLRTMVSAISGQCGFQDTTEAMVIYEDNAAAVAQVATGFIKADRVKHISPTLFGYMQDLVETKQVAVVKIESSNNISDMLTKALPAHQHRKLIKAAGMRTLQELV
jgi:hypothetical protein